MPNQDKILALEKRMTGLGIKKEDIDEKFIKSSGRGGQKVNKSSSAVFLKHKPSQLSVKCGRTRSQHLNRFLALRALLDLIEAEMSGQNKQLQEKIEKIEKIRKRKQRRKRKNKMKISRLS